MKRSFYLVVCVLSSLAFPLSAQNETSEGLDKIFHTADIDGETATQPNRRKAQITQALPEGAYRIGCLCMTGEVRSTIGTGSCNGRGGVRHWLVVNAEGDTLQYPTARQALNADKEPAPYIGPSPQMRYTTQPPTIIVMPSPANSFVDNGTPQYRDSQVVFFQGLTAADSTRRNNATDKTALYGLPMVFDSLIQLCMVLVVCGTLVLIVKMFLNQGTPQGCRKCNTRSNQLYEYAWAGIDMHALNGRTLQ